MEILLGNTKVVLLPQKALLLPELSVLVIADLHLGKAMHFRKSGIFMPKQAASADYSALAILIEQYQPLQVWFLGDLFHSTYNSEWIQFEHFRRSHSSVLFLLIKGNHDILEQGLYEKLHIEVLSHTRESGEFIFSHEPLAHVPAGKINIAGHVHPGCLLKGLGRQSVRLPCFYYHQQTLLLPAFGKLTGLYLLEKARDARVFAILPDQVFLLP